jgi:tetratricopeptide (TPR) repeat protein
MVRQPAAGYDSVVAGLDEARARSVLADMQERLVRGPIAALGLTASSTPEDARAAFLQLTKHFHPVRFGRMATDIQRLANEVFLSLRAAHDSVARTLRRPTSPIPPLPAGTPVGAPASGPANGRGQALPARGARPPSHDTGERPAVPPSVPPTPASGPRPAVARPAAPSAQAPASRPPGAVRPIGSAPPVTARDEAAVLDLLQRQQWDQARTALHQLLARDPGSKRIRALEAYARGREAQLDRRLDDARVELQDALELDPDLQAAKTALTELFTRRR